MRSEGVLVFDGQIAIVTLNDKLTYRPKQFLVCDDGDNYSGRGTVVDFEPSVTGERQPSLLFVSLIIRSQGLIQSYADGGLRYSNLVATKRLLSLQQPSLEENALVRPFPILGPRPGRDAKTEQELLGERANQVPPEQSAFLTAVEHGDLTTVKRLLKTGADITMPDFGTGLTALHLAVGRNALDVVRFLVSREASFVPDRFGRMPTTIAGECEVSTELCDFIVEAEAAAEAGAEGV